jgi:hypothetical protein
MANRRPEISATTEPLAIAALLCRRCGGRLAYDDEYCTHCGARVEAPGDATVIGIGATRQPLLPGAVAPRERPARARSRLWAAAVALLGVAALAAALTAGYYRDQYRSTSSELAASEQQLAGLEATRDRLAGELSGSKRLSERRAALLRRANGVLVGVDPLLSSVDELKSRTSEIQSARDDFLESSGAAVDALVDLGNFLIEQGESAAPERVDALIADANEKLDRAASSAARLSRYDSAYTAAARRFDLRATRLSRDVEALRRELEAVKAG